MAISEQDYEAKRITPRPAEGESEPEITEWSVYVDQGDGTLKTVTLNTAEGAYPTPEQVEAAL